MVLLLLQLIITEKHGFIRFEKLYPENVVKILKSYLPTFHRLYLSNPHGVWKLNEKWQTYCSSDSEWMQSWNAQCCHSVIDCLFHVQLYCKISRPVYTDNFLSALRGILRENVCWSEYVTVQKARCSEIRRTLHYTEYITLYKVQE